MSRKFYAEYNDTLELVGEISIANSDKQILILFQGLRRPIENVFTVQAVPTDEQFDQSLNKAQAHITVLAEKIQNLKLDVQRREQDLHYFRNISQKLEQMLRKVRFGTMIAYELRLVAKMTKLSLKLNFGRQEIMKCQDSFIHCLEQQCQTNIDGHYEEFQYNCILMQSFM